MVSVVIVFALAIFAIGSVDLIAERDRRRP